MKKIVLQSGLIALGLAVGCHSVSRAQTAGATYTSYYNQYFMGIGVTNTYSTGYAHSYLGFNVQRTQGGWQLGTDGGNNGGVLMMGGVGGEFRIYSFPTTNGNAQQNFSDSQIGNLTPKFSINPQGQVKIGLTAPASPHTDYQLAVAGKLVSQSLFVTNPNNWSDFVFAPSFKLMPLAELEGYLKVNHHLPAVPAAGEVEAHGYSVTEMDAKLLQSIEELTLHVIALNKKVAELEAKLEATKQ